MARIVFAEKNISIFLCKEPTAADGSKNSVVNDTPTGTITTTVGSAAVVGVGTKFTEECIEGQYLYTTGNAIIGRVLTITDDTHQTLDAVVPASATAQALGVMAKATAVTGVSFKLGLGPKNAYKVSAAQGKAAFTTANFMYTGDDASLESETSVTDVIGEVEFDIIEPVLGTIAGSDPVPSEILLADGYGAAKMSVVLSSNSTGTATITRSIPATETVTFQVRLSSPEFTLDNKQKVYTFKNIVLNYGLSLEIGTRPTCKFNGKGNYVGDSDGIVVIEDIGTQKSRIAPTLSAKGISLVELIEYTTEALPSSSGTSNICIQKLNIPNFNAWEFDRQRNSCEDSFTASAADAKFTLTMLEDKAEAAFNPVRAMEGDRTKIYRFLMSISDDAASPTTGKKTTYEVVKCQISNVTPTTIQKQRAYDVEFQIIGATQKIMS